MVVPALTPVTMPVEDPTTATAVLELLHVPPEVALLSDVLAPIQADRVPIMGAGNGAMVMTAVAKQPAGVVKVIVADPADTPVMIPVEEPIVAIAVLLLDHVPAPDGLV